MFAIIRTIRDYSLFAIRTIRDYSLFAIRDYSLFAIRVFQTPLCFLQTWHDLAIFLRADLTLGIQYRCRN